MFPVRQGRRKLVPGVHRADARWRGAAEGPRRAGAETVLLPSDDPLPCGTPRRSVAVRLKDLAPRRRTRGEGFLGHQSFESFWRVRGVAWFERGDRPVFPLTRNPTSLGCWRLRFKSGLTHIHGGTEYKFPRDGLGSCPACRASTARPFHLSGPCTLPAGDQPLSLLFDEPQLVRSLERLPRELRVVFAASCAERLISTYDSYSNRTGRGDTAALRGILNRLWDDLSGHRMTEGEVHAKIRACEDLHPREEDRPWVPEKDYAEDAVAAAAYALRCRENGSSQEAAWA